MKTRKPSTTQNLIIAAMLLALAFFLPFLTGQVPQIGRMLSPIHIPAMLGAFVLPLPWAVPLAFLMPILRSSIFTMPVMVPMALTMAFELATYALVIGLLAPRLAKGVVGIILTLIAAMVLGRLVYGLAFFVIQRLAGGPFQFSALLTALTVEALPGIILQLIIIPPIVLALRKVAISD